jgi:hypothetical protein
MTTTEITAPTKADLYNEIGKLNIEIVKIDEQILNLEYNLDTLVDEPEFQIATQQSLREARKLKEILDASVKRIRKTLLGRLEIEVESLEKAASTDPIKEKISILSVLATLNKEVATLSKLTTV